MQHINEPADQELNRGGMPARSPPVATRGGCTQDCANQEPCVVDQQGLFGSQGIGGLASEEGAHHSTHHYCRHYHRSLAGEIQAQILGHPVKRSVQYSQVIPCACITTETVKGQSKPTSLQLPWHFVGKQITTLLSSAQLRNIEIENAFHIEFTFHFHRHCPER